MGVGTITQVNAVGIETPAEGFAQVPSGPPRPPKKRGNRKLHNWLIGFGFSWLPILSYPLMVLLRTGKFLQFLSLVFTDASIVYIGVSLTVSAMNDLGPKESARSKFYTFFLALAAMVYSVINITQQFLLQNETNTVNPTVLIVMNIVFLAAPLACGLHQYLRNNGGNNDE